jgi:hypothetical protein
MEFHIRLVVVGDDGEEETIPITCLERGEANTATLGLTVAEGKAILRELQHVVLTRQVESHLQHQRPCPHCGRARSSKDGGSSSYRTPFGKVQLPNPRWHHCRCRQQPTKTFRPMASLLTEATSPELLFLETKWASLVSYGVTTKLLHEVLPVDDLLSAQSVRNHLHRVAEREEEILGEEQLCPIQLRERDQLPLPDGPLTVGLDGGYVRGRSRGSGAQAPSDARPSQPLGWFEVIAGKSMLSFRRDDPEPAAPSMKCFGLVQGYDRKPKRRLYETLLAQGLQANQQVTFLSDGGDTVRNLQWYLSPEAEHLLDWFHITMRLTVLNQCARGLEKVAKTRAAPAPRIGEEDDEEPEPLATPAELARLVESAKHYLWHGNVARALDRLDDLRDDLLGLEDEGGPQIHKAAARMRKHVDELETYIQRNRTLIVNYGERWRNGETISTAFVESTVNQVISRRMVKRQQMQWTPRGAHLLLQVRTKVLNDDLETVFRRHYPGFRPPHDSGLPDAA